MRISLELVMSLTLDYSCLYVGPRGRHRLFILLFHGQVFCLAEIHELVKTVNCTYLIAWVSLIWVEQVPGSCCSAFLIALPFLYNCIGSTEFSLSSVARVAPSAFNLAVTLTDKPGDLGWKMALKVLFAISH